MLKIANSLLIGYAQVFFSTRRFVGLCFMIATFVIPAQGVAGLLTLGLANLWAYLLGFDKEDIRNGYYSYNGLLTGLALGLTYRLDAPLIGLLAIASLLGVLVAAALQSLFRTYLSVPVLSMPFVVTTWLVLAGSRLFHGLTYTLEPFEATAAWTALPSVVDSFLRSLGSTLFQLTPIAGVFVALGVVVFSRYAFMLAIIGLFFGNLVYTALKGDATLLPSGLVAFNFMLTAIAVGGIWVVPGIEGLALAIAGSSLCALIAATSVFVLGSLSLPVLAFPFVATTTIMIFSLKQRTSVPRFGVIAVPESTPERNLKHCRKTAARFLRADTPAFLLPVSGEWTVTQGFNGQHTHKDRWSHAWDLEINDDDECSFRGDPGTLDHFYAFDMPVYAPADGKVVTVAGHIEDNPVGQVNAERNWGNAVVIWHYGYVYTALCHLKHGTIVVSEGESVRQGQVIGKVGNSGRSVVPHLHFQVQSGPDVGAPTVASELLHFTHASGQSRVYATRGNPLKGDRIKSLAVEAGVFDTAGFPLGASWSYKVCRGGRAWRETWETEIDFGGNRFLACRGTSARIRYMVNRYVLLLFDYEGPRDTGLYWFFLGLPRLPMTREAITWRDSLPGEMMLGTPSRLLFDFVEPVVPLARLETVSRFLETGSRFSVETRLEHKGPLARRKLDAVRVVSTFEHGRSLVSLSARLGNEEYLSLEQVEDMKYT